MEIITPRELKARWEKNDRPFLLDVREAFERDIVKLEGDIHIPRGDIPKRLNELNKNNEIVVYCRSGGRSMDVCEFLEQHGFTKIKNLEGGILKCVEDIDATLQKY